MSAEGGTTGGRAKPRRNRRARTGAVGGLSAVAALAALLLSGCTADLAAGSADRPRVVAAVYPLQYVAERVAGPDATVTGLTPPGVDAHDLELTGSQVAHIAQADLVLYLAGFQPAVDEAVVVHARGTALEVTSLAGPPGAEWDHHGDHPGHVGPGHHGPGPGVHGHDRHGHDTGRHRDDGHRHKGHLHGDPHVWLDPLRLSVIAEEVAARLAEIAPEHAAAYADRAQRLRDELAALDEKFTAGLADCRRREFVVGHTAFSYLADRYGLRQIAVSGLSPEDEPTPAALTEAVRRAREHGATTIYYETLAGPRVAEVVADQVGATVAPLDPLETAPDQGDYLTRMRENLAALRAGLECR